MAAPRSEPLSINTEFLSNFSVGSRFTDLRPIGYGSNGLVLAGVDSECEKHVAIKKISFHDQISSKFALREIKIMRGLEHENIVKVHECLGPDGTSLEALESDLHAVYIVQELLDGDLHSLIQSGQLTEAHAQLFLYQLLRGLKYLHSANVLHRDLKPSNLLVNYDDLTLKMTDFGLSRILDPCYNHKGFLTENIGTTWYRSPEHVISPNDYDSSIDMWSTGCIFGEMLLGRTLFPGAHEINQLHLILDSIELEESDWNHVMRWLPNKLLKNHPLETRTPLRERLPDVDALAMDLLERLLCFNPADRLTAEEALTHPYFSDLHNDNDEPVVVEPFSIEHEVDDLSLSALKEMIVSEVTDHTVTCGQKVSSEAALPSKIVNKNLRNQLIHNKVNLERCRVNTDVTGTPIVTESKTAGISVDEANKNIPNKVEFFQEGSFEELKAKSIEDVTSNDESSDGEKESYQSMLEHLNKMNMANSLIETPKKKKTEAVLKKEVEKGYDDEKDTAEYSTRKYEEDQELNIMKIKYDNDFNEIYDIGNNYEVYQSDGEREALKITKTCAEPLLIEDFMFPRTNTVIDLEQKYRNEQKKDMFEKFPSCLKTLQFDALMTDSDENIERYKYSKNIYSHENVTNKCFESLCIDTNEIENFKEFSQPSPKENSDEDDDNIVTWNNVDNSIQSSNEQNPSVTFIQNEDSSTGEECNKMIEEIDSSFTEDQDELSNLVSLRNFTNSRESDLDSSFSSDSNKQLEEAQNLALSASFSSTEKLKDLCDSENERCRTPSDPIPDKEDIKRKLNELNQKKLKEIANHGVPTIDEDTDFLEKNDKNRTSQSEGCRPKTKDDSSRGINTEIVPNSLEGQRPNNPSVKSINLHQLRQEINERLKEEEVQARTGELAAGGGWNATSLEAENFGVASQRRGMRRTQGARNRRNSLISETRSVPNEYALPQPRWPCGEVGLSETERLATDRNHSNSNNIISNRRGSFRSVRKKTTRKTKAL